ncbi:MAG: dienelactone hydrolase family protein [Humibacter sp.]
MNEGHGAPIAAPVPSPVRGYDDWPTHALAASPFVAGGGNAQRLADVLGLRSRPETPEVLRDEPIEHGDVVITPLRWRMPYGPETQAWEVRAAGAAASDPAGATGGNAPGILALHSHGGRRSVGANALIDFGGENPDAIANRLAREGFVVLAHDAFSWASRRFDLSVLTPKLAVTRDALLALWASEGRTWTDDELFDAVSNAHEELLAKVAGSLGQTFAGMVVADDLVALDVLAGLPGVDASRLAAIGFSGGGGRAHLLGALDHRLGAVVVGGMMATFASMMPAYIEAHSWLLHSPGLWQVTDWPDVARIGGDRELLALYGERDPLFPLDGMRDAHASLSELPGYVGRFFDAGHEFTPGMKDVAASFLSAWAARAQGSATNAAHEEPDPS